MQNQKLKQEKFNLYNEIAIYAIILTKKEIDALGSLLTLDVLHNSLSFQEDLPIFEAIDNKLTQATQGAQ